MKVPLYVGSMGVRTTSSLTVGQDITLCSKSHTGTRMHVTGKIFIDIEAQSMERSRSAATHYAKISYS